MPEKFSEVCSMRESIAAAAGPEEWFDNRKSWLGRAANRAGISYRQAKSLFYGEITDPEHKSARRMREAAARNGQATAGQLAGQFDTIASSLRATDQDFHRDTIAALLSAARVLRNLDRTGDSGEG